MRRAGANEIVPRQEIVAWPCAAYGGSEQQLRRPPGRPSRTATQKPAPVAVADADMATAERPSRAVIELVIGATTVGAVISSERHIEATMVTKSSRQECRILPADINERTIHRRIDLFAGVGAGCTSEERQYGELKNRHTYSRIMRGVAITITLRRPDRNDPTGGLLTAPSAQGAVREPLMIGVIFDALRLGGWLVSSLGGRDRPELRRRLDRQPYRQASAFAFLARDRNSA